MHPSYCRNRAPLRHDAGLPVARDVDLVRLSQPFGPGWIRQNRSIAIIDEVAMSRPAGVGRKQDRRRNTEAGVPNDPLAVREVSCPPRQFHPKLQRPTRHSIRRFQGEAYVDRQPTVAERTGNTTVFSVDTSMCLDAWWMSNAASIVEIDAQVGVGDIPPPPDRLHRGAHAAHRDLWRALRESGRRIDVVAVARTRPPPPPGVLPVQ